MGRIASTLGDDTRAILEVIGRTLLYEAQAAFETKKTGAVGSDGIQWPKLHPKTVKRKGSNVIGIDTGLMRNSILEGPHYSDDATWVEYDRPYVHYFDRGTKKKDGSVRSPARPLLPVELPPKWQDSIEASVQDYLDELAEALEEVR